MESYYQLKMYCRLTIYIIDKENNTAKITLRNTNVTPH